MNDRQDIDADLVSLEEELRGLAPTGLSGEFEERLGRSVNRPRRGSWLWGAGSAVAAACLVMMFSGPVGSGTGEANQPQLPAEGNSVIPVSDGPVRSTHSWERTFDDGPVLIDERIPARQVTRQKLRTVRYRDPVRNVVIEIVIPEQQVRYIDLEVN